MNLYSLRLLGELRRIAQALDTHSKYLEQTVGLTLPQVLVLEALRPEAAPLSAGLLAARVSLTQGTVTTILDRLEAKGLARRTRANDDRRRVLVSLTARGRRVLVAAPPLLQTHFINQFETLPDAEQATTVAVLERVVGLMRAPDTPPLLATGA